MTQSIDLTQPIHIASDFSTSTSSNVSVSSTLFLPNDSLSSSSIEENQPYFVTRILKSVLSYLRQLCCCFYFSREASSSQSASSESISTPFSELSREERISLFQTIVEEFLNDPLEIDFPDNIDPNSDITETGRDLGKTHGEVWNEVKPFNQIILKILLFIAKNAIKNFAQHPEWTAEEIRSCFYQGFGPLRDLSDVTMSSVYLEALESFHPELARIFKLGDFFNLPIQDSSSSMESSSQEPSISLDQLLSFGISESLDESSSFDQKLERTLEVFNRLKDWKPQAPSGQTLEEASIWKNREEVWNMIMPLALCLVQPFVSEISLRRVPVDIKKSDFGYVKKDLDALHTFFSNTISDPQCILVYREFSRLLYLFEQLAPPESEE